MAKQKAVYYNPVIWKKRGNKLIHKVTGKVRMLKRK